MAIDVIMPKMGESITEGTILEWKKKVGANIKRDEVLLEISSDKVMIIRKKTSERRTTINKHCLEKPRALFSSPIDI